MAEITVGDVVRVDATFTADGADPDPTTVVVKYEPPNGSRLRLLYGTDAEVVKSATGKYYVDLTTDRPGEWRVEYEGRGTVRASHGVSFQVASQGVDL